MTKTPPLAAKPLVAKPRAAPLDAPVPPEDPAGPVASPAAAAPLDPLPPALAMLPVLPLLVPPAAAPATAPAFCPAVPTLCPEAPALFPAPPATPVPLLSVAGEAAPLSTLDPVVPELQAVATSAKTSSPCEATFMRASRVRPRKDPHARQVTP